MPTLVNRAHGLGLVGAEVRKWDERLHALTAKDAAKAVRGLAVGLTGLAALRAGLKQTRKQTRKRTRKRKQKQKHWTLCGLRPPRVFFVTREQPVQRHGRSDATLGTHF